MSQRPAALRAADRPYYHGTMSLKAARAMASGEPLRWVPQDGATRLAGSVVGYAYLSPTLGVAVDYAAALGRKDRPGWDARQRDEDGRGFVFAFDLTGVRGLRLEEDELGNAARMSLEALSFGWGADRYSGPFLARLRERGDLMAALVAAVEKLPDSVAGRFRSQQVPATIGVLAKVGRALAGRLDHGLAQELVDLGINLAVSEPVTPFSGWQLPRHFARWGKPQDWDRFVAVASPLADPAAVDAVRPTVGEWIEDDPRNLVVVAAVPDDQPWSADGVWRVVEKSGQERLVRNEPGILHRVKWLSAEAPAPRLGRRA